jgi:hypothetical protein
MIELVSFVGLAYGKNNVGSCVVVQSFGFWVRQVVVGQLVAKVILKAMLNVLALFKDGGPRFLLVGVIMNCLALRSGVRSFS